MNGRLLVAGLGNVFLGDDGFGVAVAGRLAVEPRPDWVRVVDYGIRGVHLAYDLMAGYDALVLVDALGLGEPPGTVQLLEITPGDRSGGLELGPTLLDPHGMQPQRVLDLVDGSGDCPDRVLLVGCEPADVSEGIGLSAAVEAAVEPAAALVRQVWDAGLAAVVSGEFTGTGAR